MSRETIHVLPALKTCRYYLPLYVAFTIHLMNVKTTNIHCLHLIPPTTGVVMSY